jgi:cytochrome c peroxidase
MRWGHLLITLFLGISCGKEVFAPGDTPFEPYLPAGFPTPVAPTDNGYSPARWKLGKRLFYDPALSRDSSVSCASCHHHGYAFSDTLALSLGVAGRIGTRNAPSLANVAYHPYFLREGGVPTLEMQVAVPVQEHHEFDFNFLLLAGRLSADPSYLALSREAYGRDPDPYVISRALAVFQRSLLSGDSPYDRFRNGGTPLPAEARRGMDLFFSDRTGCAACHGGLLFSTFGLENNGLYAAFADPGRMRLTGLPEDEGRFKVPSLRNVGVTAPYMHDGALATLSDVLEHYRKGGAGHPHQSPLVRTLDLSDRERDELLAFLLTLTDTPFLNNAHFLPDHE